MAGIELGTRVPLADLDLEQAKSENRRTASLDLSQQKETCEVIVVDSAFNCLHGWVERTTQRNDLIVPALCDRTFQAPKCLNMYSSIAFFRLQYLHVLIEL